MFLKKLVIFLGLFITVCIVQINVFETNNAQACKCMRGEACVLGVCILLDPMGNTTSNSGHVCWTKWSGTNIATCMIGTDFRKCIGNMCSCSANSYKYCAEGRCGTFINGTDISYTGLDESLDGDMCKVTTKGLDTCSHTITGKWDKSEGRCVICSTDGTHREIRVAGDISGTYVVSGPVVSAAGVVKANDKFEYACNADSRCDEKDTGDVCDTDSTCDSSGDCITAPVGALVLTASANPTAMAPGDVSVVTFKVTLAGAPYNGATVGNISHNGGGSLSGNTCTTGAAGTCTVNYTGHIVSEVATVTAAKATNGVDNDSSSAEAIITVDSADYECDASSTPSYGNVDCVGGFDIGNCEDLNGDTAGCGGGEWKNCDSCNPVCISGSTGCQCYTKYEACSCVCSEASCTPSWSGWSAWSSCSAGSQSSTQSDTNGCSSSQTKTRDCCTTTDVAPADGVHDDCAGAAGDICDTSYLNGKCVECVTSGDCAGTDVCYDGACIPCSGEDEVPPADSPELCCEGLGYWDKNYDGNPVCTSACDPRASFFCNSLRGTVETLVEGGEVMIGYILGLIGSVALLLIIIAGIMYMTAAGVEEKITSAKRILTGAVIGLGIALLSFSLLQVIITVLDM